MSKLNKYKDDANIKIVNGVCSHDCPDACGWQVAVDESNGQAIDIWGHADHSVTRGALCGKVDRYMERVYHAERLQRPLRRVGPKGSGQFEAVSWDEALADIAARLHDVIDEHGPEAVLPYSFAGTMGILQGEGMASRLFNRMGASQLARSICSQAGIQGYTYTIGDTEGMETESYAHAKLILIWGSPLSRKQGRLARGWSSLIQPVPVQLVQQKRSRMANGWLSIQEQMVRWHWR